MKFYVDSGENGLKTKFGKILDGVVQSSGTEEGMLIFGPHIKLKEGKYKVVYHGKLLEYGYLGAYTDVSYNCGQTIIKRGLVDSNQKNFSTIEFELNEAVENFEARLWVSLSCLVHVEYIEINEMPPNSNKAPLMNISRNKPYILMTGNVRDPSFLATRLRYFQRLKEDGLIKQLIWSTWLNQWDKYDEIKSIVIASKFLIIQAPEPNFLTRGHYYHQIINLENGLNACPDDSFVLKTRTDKSDETPFDIGKVLATGKYANLCNDKKFGLQYKIGIFGNLAYFSRSLPLIFFWSDRTYIGQKKDIQRILNHNVIDTDIRSVSPEQVLFSTYFSQRLPEISAFYKCVNQLGLIHKFLVERDKELLTNIDKNASIYINDKVISAAIASERKVQYACFFDMLTGQGFDLDFTYRGMTIPAENRNCEDFDADIKDVDIAQCADLISKTTGLESNFRDFQKSFENDFRVWTIESTKLSIDIF